MNVLKKRLLISIIFLAIILVLLQTYNRNLCNIQTSTNNQPLRVSILFHNYTVNFLELLTKDMKKVEQENAGTVQYTFYDGKGDQRIQDNQLNNIISSKEVDLIIFDLVDVTHTKSVIDKIKQTNIPIIFAYNGDSEAVKSYEKAFLASTSPAEGGTLEGKIIVDAWKKNKIVIDKNQDNILNYILLLGSPNNIISSDRSKYSILTIKKNNIQTQEISSRFCYWSQDQAKEAVKQSLLRFGNNIEAIIAVEDGMAIGAIEALQGFGYNLGDNQRNITVVGCDGIPEALELIKKGAMTGTVIQDTYKIANDFYKFEMNLMNNKSIIDGTDCTIDNSGKLITIPFSGVVVNLA